MEISLYFVVFVIIINIIFLYYFSQNTNFKLYFKFKMVKLNYYHSTKLSFLDLNTISNSRYFLLTSYSSFWKYFLVYHFLFNYFNFVTTIKFIKIYLIILLKQETLYQVQIHLSYFHSVFLVEGLWNFTYLIFYYNQLLIIMFIAIFINFDY